MGSQDEEVVAYWISYELINQPEEYNAYICKRKFHTDKLYLIKSTEWIYASKLFLMLYQKFASKLHVYHKQAVTNWFSHAIRE